MCGFVGIVNFNKSPVDIGVLSKMTEIQKHRGPDDEGRTLFSLNDGTFKVIPRDCRDGKMAFSGGLGFNRLSILDLSSHGSQLWSVPTKMQSSHSMEKFTTFELRPELEQKAIPSGAIPIQR